MGDELEGTAYAGKVGVFSITAPPAGWAYWR
jgi:hypothetical protein